MRGTALQGRFWAAIALGCLGLAGYAGLPARAQIAVRNQGYVPYSDAPINYRTQPLSDPDALLQKRLDAGKASLVYDQQHGYLKSVLKLLDIPRESQTLVFSKTSFQFSKIAPDHPRALYYNDDVYVGSVHQGKTVEIVSFDPMQGAIFYLLDDQKSAKPVFQRAELDCTQCHIAAGTRGVPGVLLRSVYASQTGSLTPRSPQYITDQKSPLSNCCAICCLPMRRRWAARMGAGRSRNRTSPANLPRGACAMPRGVRCVISICKRAPSVFLAAI